MLPRSYTFFSALMPVMMCHKFRLCTVEFNFCVSVSCVCLGDTQLRFWFYINVVSLYLHVGFALGTLYIFILHYIFMLVVHWLRSISSSSFRYLHFRFLKWLHSMSSSYTLYLHVISLSCTLDLHLCITQPTVGLSVNRSALNLQAPLLCNQHNNSLINVSGYEVKTCIMLFPLLSSSLAKCSYIWSIYKLNENCAI